jgi:hypothetical protein
MAFKFKLAQLVKFVPDGGTEPMPICRIDGPCTGKILEYLTWRQLETWNKLENKQLLVVARLGPEIGIPHDRYVLMLDHEFYECTAGHLAPA